MTAPPTRRRDRCDDWWRERERERAFVVFFLWESSSHQNNFRTIAFVFALFQLFDCRFETSSSCGTSRCLQRGLLVEELMPSSPPIPPSKIEFFFSLQIKGSRSVEFFSFSFFSTSSQPLQPPSFTPLRPSSSTTRARSPTARSSTPPATAASPSASPWESARSSRAGTRASPSSPRASAPS